MSFPSKSEREKCWTSRDLLWKCLDDNNGSQEACAKFREMYETTCPSQWVKHFDRKREYLKFKDRIQKEGYEPLNEAPKPIKSDDKQSSKPDNQKRSSATS